MKLVHKNLAMGKWQEMSFMTQMSNIGMEVDRAVKWKIKGNKNYSMRAFFRAIELLNLSIIDIANKNRLKELTRLTEVLGEYFIGDNKYKCSDEFLYKYFYAFNYASRVNGK